MRPTTATITATILAGLVALGGLGCARKQQTANVDAIFIKYDTDRNGRITRDEFTVRWKDKQKADTAWKKLDPTGNGFVSRTLANDVPFDVWDEIETQSEP